MNRVQTDSSIAARGPGRCAVATVTYGQRWHLLRQVIASARDDGFDLAVVVDNGSGQEIATLALAEFGAFVDVVRLERNRGSAGGFKAAMSQALLHDVAYLLIVDDDNRIDPGCRMALMAAHRHWALSVSPEVLAIQAYRDRQKDLAIGTPSRGMHSDNPFAYFGFHVMDLPAKILRRTPLGRRRESNRAIRKEVIIDNSPYSGLFFHRSLIEKLGLPDERFVLYCDDLEFSSRVTRAGGKIVLSTAAHLSDLEQSWDHATGITNAFDARLIGDGDFRAFYSARNNAYFEAFILGKPGFQRWLNRRSFFAILWFVAVVRHRMPRYRLLRKAIQDGERGLLGEHPDYLLQ